MHLPPILLQVTLLAAFSAADNAGFYVYNRPDEHGRDFAPAAIPTTGPSYLAPLLPTCNKDASIIWQPRPPTFSSAMEYKRLTDTASPGHDTARRTMHLPPILLQVSYNDHYKCYRSSNPYLLIVSCPSDLLNWRKWLVICAQTCVNIALSNLLLLLSGDIETNPGPDDCPQLASILQTVQRIEQGQSQLLTEIRGIKETQTRTDGLVQELSLRVTALEGEITSLKSPVQGAELPSSTVQSLTQQLEALRVSSDDANNRLRGNNPLFFGLQDSQSETWAQSEGMVVAFCAGELGINIDPNNVERAHRLGKYAENKNRLIIMKLTHFKDKERILARGLKLKDTNFAIREDFSTDVRQARSKLIQFAKTQNTPFKLRFDKLIIGNSCYAYDIASGDVKRTNR
ncbi:uncharacterized protein ISCGN_019345 [Ixodes scapularis]